MGSFCLCFFSSSLREACPCLKWAGRASMCPLAHKRTCTQVLKIPSYWIHYAAWQLCLKALIASFRSVFGDAAGTLHVAGSRQRKVKVDTGVFGNVATEFWITQRSENHTTRTQATLEHNRSQATHFTIELINKGEQFWNAMIFLFRLACFVFNKAKRLEASQRREPNPFQNKMTTNPISYLGKRH